MRQIFKQLALSVEKKTGVFRRRRLLNRSRLLVLCYHSVVGDRSPVNSRTNIAVLASQFEEQMATIRRDWQPVSLADVDAACHRNQRLPDFSLLVTFDDGFRNNLAIAAPLLKKYDIPAIVFVTSAMIGNTELLWPQEVRERLIDGTQPGAAVPVPETRNAKSTLFPTRAVSQKTLDQASFADTVVGQCKKLPTPEKLAYIDQLRSCTQLNIDEHWKRELYGFMTWDEVREIRDFGVAVGAHTVSHPILSTLSPEKTSDELSKCKTVIERELSEECFSIAYPNGGRSDFNDAVVTEAQRLGFRVGFNLFERRNAETLTPMSIDRCCITRDVTQLEFEKKLVLV